MAAPGCTRRCGPKVIGAAKAGPAAADAPPPHPGAGRETPSALHDQQPPPPGRCAQPARASRFEAPAPNRIWLADITYIPTGEGWLHLAAVLDLATRKIVGWAMRDHMRTELALSGLMMAVQRQRPAPGLVHHSDRGGQFAAEAYVEQLTAVGAVPSMSRTGNCYDNAPMESFFHTLKVELVHQHRWATRDEARRDLFGYIEGHYNRARIHSALGYPTPEQAEKMASQTPVHQGGGGSRAMPTAP